MKLSKSGKVKEEKEKAINFLKVVKYARSFRKNYDSMSSSSFKKWLFK
ncbi:MAG: hypothetical protein WC549_00340 [Actinomycetota bacterium]